MEFSSFDAGGSSSFSESENHARGIASPPVKGLSNDICTIVRYVAGFRDGTQYQDTDNPIAFSRGRLYLRFNFGPGVGFPHLVAEQLTPLVGIPSTSDPTGTFQNSPLPVNPFGGPPPPPQSLGQEINYDDATQANSVVDSVFNAVLPTRALMDSGWPFPNPSVLGSIVKTVLGSAVFLFNDVPPGVIPGFDSATNLNGLDFTSYDGTVQFSINGALADTGINFVDRAGVSISGSDNIEIFLFSWHGASLHHAGLALPQGGVKAVDYAQVFAALERVFPKVEGSTPGKFVYDFTGKPYIFARHILMSNGALLLDTYSVARLGPPIVNKGIARAVTRITIPVPDMKQLPVELYSGTDDSGIPLYPIGRVNFLIGGTTAEKWDRVRLAVV
jgi:hypothetical protein